MPRALLEGIQPADGCLPQMNSHINDTFRHNYVNAGIMHNHAMEYGGVLKHAHSI